MPLATNLKRHKDITRLLVKYGRAAALERAELDQLVAEPEAAAGEAAEPKAEELAADLEALGPTFVKLGQILSTRADLLPVPYLEALSRLQDNVDAFPFAEVEAIVQQELGVRLSKAFAEFDPQPLAAASLGQVAVALRARGVAADAASSLDHLVEAALASAAPGDVLITMSSGSFGGVPRRLLEELGAQVSPASPSRSSRI